MCVCLWFKKGSLAFKSTLLSGSTDGLNIFWGFSNIKTDKSGSFGLLSALPFVSSLLSRLALRTKKNIYMKWNQRPWSDRELKQEGSPQKGWTAPLMGANRWSRGARTAGPLPAPTVRQSAPLRPALDPPRVNLCQTPQSRESFSEVTEVNPFQSSRSARERAKPSPWRHRLWNAALSVCKCVFPLALFNEVLIYF